MIQNIYAMQDDTHTSLMMQIGDDPPVCVFRYSRELARDAKSVTGIEVNNAGPVRAMTTEARLYAIEAIHALVKTMHNANYTGFLKQVTADAGEGA